MQFYNIDVSKEWSDMMVNDNEGEIHSVVDFVDNCLIPALNENKLVFCDFTKMILPPTTQKLYFIASRLVKVHSFSSNDIITRLSLYDKHDPLISNYFIRAVFESTGEIPPYKEG